MRAMDVMTTAVVTVSPDSTVQDLAKLMSERGISGVPVVENGRLVGIVSEGDLLHRAETGTERRTARRRWRWFDRSLEEARDYTRAHARAVRDIMTREVISVGETTELAEVATLMETKRIKRVPVLRNGMLVGIVSRANLVRAVAAIDREPATGAAAAGDREIRAKPDSLDSDELTNLADPFPISRVTLVTYSLAEEAMSGQSEVSALIHHLKGGSTTSWSKRRWPIWQKSRFRPRKKPSTFAKTCSTCKRSA